MPPQYLLLVQRSGCPCEVIFYDSDKQSRNVMFSGGRWEARRYFRDLRLSIGWETVPAFVEKKARGGFPPSVIACQETAL